MTLPQVIAATWFLALCCFGLAGGLDHPYRPGSMRRLVWRTYLVGGVLAVATTVLIVVEVLFV